MAEKSGTILTLINRLRSIGPPSISDLIAKLGEIDEYHEFLLLIRDYVPDYEEDILTQPAQAGQIARFCSRFEDRYFPLQYRYHNGYVDEELTYYDLVMQIPVMIRGFSWNDYDELSSYGRPGAQLITYLLENPHDEDGERVSFAEACQEHVSRELLERVPETGLEIRQAHELFDNTLYAPIAKWGDWLCQDTGNFFLDTDIEMLGYNYPYPEWDKDEVEILTRHWQEADQIDEEIDNFFLWLEEDKEARFKEILDFIDSKE